MKEKEKAFLFWSSTT